MNFTVIDWVFSILIVVFTLSGLIKGFINNVFGKIAFIAGIFLGWLFYKDLAVTLLKDIKVQVAANVIAFLLIFVVTFLIIKIVQMIVSKVFEWSILNSLDHTLGLLFGIVEGMAVVCLIIFILTAQPFFNAQKVFGDSFYFNIVNSLFNASKEEIGNHV